MTRLQLSSLFLCGFLLSQTTCYHHYPGNNGRMEGNSYSLNMKTGTLSSSSLPAQNNVEKLVMNICSFSKVLPDTFKVMPNLKTIIFKATSINELQSGAFDGCNNLEEINFKAGGVKTMAAKTFSNLSNLKKITFDAFPVHDIVGEIFKGSNNLEEIDFEASGIINLDSKTFTNLPGLKTLKFEASPIGDLKANMFTGDINLNVLKINACGFQKADAKAFSGLNNLRELDLGGNCIKGFSFANLPALPKLELVNLEGNPLANIDSSNIKNKFPNLKTIRLSSNAPLPESIKRDLENHQITLEYNYANSYSICSSYVYI